MPAVLAMQGLATARAAKLGEPSLEIREQSCRVDADPDFTSFHPGYAWFNSSSRGANGSGPKWPAR
jgi:hypothetical protein